MIGLQPLTKGLSIQKRMAGRKYNFTDFGFTAMSFYKKILL